MYQDPTLYTKILEEITGFPSGTVFETSQFTVPDFQKGRLNGILRNLNRKGIIIRLAKGKFYKPKNPGQVNKLPDMNQVIKALTVKNSMTIGYVTGPSLYKKWRLVKTPTNTLHLAVNQRIKSHKFHSIKIKYIKQEILITQENIPLLQILDAIKDFKKLETEDEPGSLQKLVGRLGRLTDNSKWELLGMSQQYNTQTQRRLRKILEDYFPGINV